MSMYDRPCAARGLNSYRYRLAYDFIMVGAKDDADALHQASLSTYRTVTMDRLERWDGSAYVPVRHVQEEVQPS